MESDRQRGSGLYVVPLADLVADVEATHANTPGLLHTEDASAAALAAFLRGHGADAEATADGNAVTYHAANDVAAQYLNFACVCVLASVSYRNEAAGAVRFARS